MHTAEVIVNSIEGNGVAKVFNLLAEAVRQPREPSHRHSHREVHSFDVAGRDMLAVGMACDGCSGGSEALRRAVARLGFNRLAVNLDQRGVVDFSTKGTFHGVQINAVPIGSELHAIGESRSQVLHELVSTTRVTQAHEIGDRQLGICVNCGPGPHITVAEDAFPVSGNVLRFRIAELPDFVTLNPARLYSAYHAVVKFCAGLSYVFEQAQDCSLGYTCKPARSPDGISFNQSINDTNLFGERKYVHVQYYA